VTNETTRTIEGEYEIDPGVPTSPSALAVHVETGGLVAAPEFVLGEAQKAAAALKRVIDSKPKRVSFGGETYLELEDWELLGQFYGFSVRVEWSRPIEHGAAKGWEARATLLDRAGNEVGGAESMCLNDERNWKGKDTFSIRSMAQTRACAKAFRQRLSWIPVLAGYKGTPSEEMPAPEPPPPPKVEVVPQIDEETRVLLEKHVIGNEAKRNEVREWMRSHGYPTPKVFYERVTNEEAMETLTLVGFDPFQILTEKGR